MSDGVQKMMGSFAGDGALMSELGSEVLVSLSAASPGGIGSSVGSMANVPFVETSDFHKAYSVLTSQVDGVVIGATVLGGGAILAGAGALGVFLGVLVGAQVGSDVAFLINEL